MTAPHSEERIEEAAKELEHYTFACGGCAEAGEHEECEIGNAKVDEHNLAVLQRLYDDGKKAGREEVQRGRAKL